MVLVTLVMRKASQYRKGGLSVEVVCMGGFIVFEIRMFVTWCCKNMYNFWLLIKFIG